MDDTELVALRHLQVSGIDNSPRSDVDAVAGAVGWLAEKYLMSDAFARILLSQLARQDGVTEAAAARGLLAAAVIDAATSTSLP